ncbi:MAG: DHH family phosphoesterase, partial [Lachnospiraceae bacterium]|nr:DHH family phosphoesterase [Lachnospiraceae bacterium]
MTDTKEKDTVWVIGHRNPDTDSVCAAVAYAFLKNQIDDRYQYIAKKAGPLNGETRYVLRRFSCP